ncbi:LysR family transcriptional regulator [Pseudomonas helleri]|uniref:LysR family transcriptional regulator n=1 Tax=Pseudomonas helleri TaxID=1608996 RepID=UPI003F97335F
MESLSGLNAFVIAARLGSYVAAAERLGISASAVGKSVARLEDGLGVRLFNRSTRRLSLTEGGTLFFERCSKILDELEEAEVELHSSRDAPRGRLRVSLPAIGYRMLLPILGEFTRRYPEIELDMDFSDRMVDVIGEGMDAVIRSGDFADSRLKSKPLGTFHFVLVGAPDYFARQGVPQTPHDLKQHVCLRYRFPSNGQLQEWAFTGDEDDSLWKRSTPLVFNNLEALISAATGGFGLAYVPDFAVRQALQSQQLVAVLADHISAHGRFSVLWPSSRHLLPKLRVFVDFLAEHMTLNARPNHP